MNLWNWLFAKKPQPSNDTELSRELLRAIYKKKITGTNNFEVEVVEYDPAGKRIKFKIRAPHILYLIRDVPIVTFFVHAFVMSELPYVFTYFLVRDVAGIPVTPRDYEKMARLYRLRFKRFAVDLKGVHRRNRYYYAELKVRGDVRRKKKAKEGRLTEYLLCHIDFKFTGLDGEEFGEGETLNFAILSETKAPKNAT